MDASTLAEEVEAAVQKFVQNAVVVNKDTLGPIDVSSRFDEVMQLFASTLIFDPNALFYLIYLASNKLCADTISALALLTDVQTAIDEINRKTTKISQTTLLGDAAAALTVMSSILAQNSAVSTPPYERYVAAIDKFRDVSLKDNIRDKSGEVPVIVRSAPEAKLSAVSSLSGLRSAYPELLARADVLLTMVDQYTALNLPAISLLQSLQKARQDLITLQQALESPTATEDQKIAMSRDAYLRITAGKAVVTNLRGVKKPTDLRMVSTAPNVVPAMTGSVVIPSAPGAFVPATVQTAVTTTGWSITAGINDTIIIAEDGNTATTYTIPVAGFPSITSFGNSSTYPIYGNAPAVITTAVGPFNIPSINATFYVTVDGMLFAGSITQGSSVTADSVALSLSLLQSVNTVGFAYVLQSYVSISSVGGKVTISSIGSGLHSIQVSDNDQDGVSKHRYLTSLGITVTNATSTVANNELCIDNLNPLVSLGTISRSTPNVPIVVEKINTWASTNNLPYFASSVYLTHDPDESPMRFKITKNVAGTQSITMTLPADSNRGTVAAAYALLGFYEGQTDSSTSISAAELATVINDQNKVTATVVKGVGGEYVKIASKSTGLNTELVIGAGTANSTLGLVAGVYKGTTTGFTAYLSGKAQDPIDYDVIMGDVFYFPENSEKSHGTITSITGNVINIDPPFSTSDDVTSFKIESGDYIKYLAFVGTMNAAEEKRSTTKYESNTLELDRLMNPLLQAKMPIESQVTDAENGAKVLQGVLEQLRDALKGYVINRVPRIDACVNMLRERGLDRAYDTLMRGDLINFFSYDKDEAATAAYMLKTMRVLAQQDLPISKISETLDDTVLQSSAITSDANFDFSDRDNENLKLLGSVPDLDTDTTVPANYFKSTY